MECAARTPEIHDGVPPLPATPAAGADFPSPLIGEARSPQTAQVLPCPAKPGAPRRSPLSIIIPALNEAAGIAAFLEVLQPLRDRGVELILADGGSDDDTAAIAAPLVDQVIQAPRGRALQMNAGAALAHGDVLLFLHADSRLPAEADRLVLEGLRASGRRWGRFDVKLSGRAATLRLVERMMNLRSRLTGIATGDQGLFIERGLFRESGGFPAIALMEDVAFTSRLRRHGRPLCLGEKIITSSRRWETNGIWRTIVLMWSLRIAYFLGMHPDRLARIYHGRKA